MNFEEVKTILFKLDNTNKYLDETDVNNDRYVNFVDNISDIGSDFATYKICKNNDTFTFGVIINDDHFFKFKLKKTGKFVSISFDVLNTANITEKDVIDVYNTNCKVIEKCLRILNTAKNKKLLQEINNI